MALQRGSGSGLVEANLERQMDLFGRLRATFRGFRLLLPGFGPVRRLRVRPRFNAAARPLPLGPLPSDFPDGEDREDRDREKRA